MTSDKTPIVAITPIGRSACATVGFRSSDQLRVAAIVKATFHIAHDGVMVPVDPDPIAPEDQHRRCDPTKSVVMASDLAPYRPRADVTLVGHARALRGQPAPMIGVRLMVARGQNILLDKRLAVRGPRGRSGETSPFTELPLDYELAAGGTVNPVGMPPQTGAWPRILDRWHRPRPVGFGPIGDRWPTRRGLLHDRAVLDASIPRLPGDFPWSYFNAAPEDQRIDFLRGDEWVGFEGMHAELSRVQSRLPGMRGVARLYGPGAGLVRGRSITLVADTLSIDADRMRVSVVWRGSFGVSSEAELPLLHVFAGVEKQSKPIAFPAVYEAPGALAKPMTKTVVLPTMPMEIVPTAVQSFEAPRIETRRLIDQVITAVLPEDETVKLRAEAVLPFATTAPLPPREPLDRRLPPATPFDRVAMVSAHPSPSPLPPSPLPPMPEGEMMAHAPIPPAPALPKMDAPPVAEAMAGASEEPATPGGLFLAAMGRAAQRDPLKERRGRDAR